MSQTATTDHEKRPESRIAGDLRELLEARLSSWEQLPNLDLYMDQLLFCIERENKALDAGNLLSASMVNNYIKEGHLPRANGKRYKRGHLALLIMLSQLKNSLQVKDCGQLLSILSGEAKTADDEHIEKVYELYREHLDSALQKALENLEGSDVGQSQEALAGLALRFALESYVNKRVCEILLKELGEG